MSLLSFLFLSYDWLFLAITALVLLYLRASRYRNYWRDQNVVHEKFSLFFGAQTKQLFKPLHVVEQELYRKHGRLFGSFEDGKPVLYVGEPGLLRLILVKDAGLTERKMQEIINRCAAALLDRSMKAVTASEDIDLTGFYGQFTLDSVARCSFGVVLSPNSPEEASFIRSAKNFFFAEVTPFVVLSAFFQKLGHTFRKRLINERAFDFYKNATIDIIRKREEGNIRHEDFLQMMMNAKEVSKNVASGGEALSGSDIDSSEKKPTDVKNLTEEEALAQCVLFFLAGQDTVSSTASFASYLLATNPQVQEKLQAEVDECFRKHGNSPSYDVVSRLPYLDCVVNETLRIMPTGSRTDRVFHEDYMLGETGIKLSKDCVVIIPIHSIHHDPEFFPEPEVFNPDRFNEENISSIRPYTYLPFGAGPRNCIGSRFALQLLKTCILHAVHRVEFVKCARTKVPLEYRTGFGLLVPKDMVVGVKERRG